MLALLCGQCTCVEIPITSYHYLICGEVVIPFMMDNSVNAEAIVFLCWPFYVLREAVLILASLS